MAAFKKSLELLREHRFVDYKQLGLNYQLYSCEVRTNFIISFRGALFRALLNVHDVAILQRFLTVFSCQLVSQKNLS